MLSSTIALFGLLTIQALATATSSAPTAAESALTPQGWHNAANVHEVPKGGKVNSVGDQVQLLDASGNVLHTSTNDHTVTGIRPAAAPSANKRAADLVESGWIAYAYWNNTGSDPINFFEATWTVPPAPPSYIGQTLFYSITMESASGDETLQPVLQYGPSTAGGGEYWSLVNWYLVGSDVYYSAPVEVSVGTSLLGYIALVDTPGAANIYELGFNTQTVVEIESTEVLAWVAIALEAWSVSDLSNFPQDAPTFSAINVVTTAGTADTTWSAVSDTDDGIYTTINIQSPVNAEVTIST